MSKGKKYGYYGQITGPEIPYKTNVIDLISLENINSDGLEEKWVVTDLGIQTFENRDIVVNNVRFTTSETGIMEFHDVEITSVLLDWIPSGGKVYGEETIIDFVVQKGVN